MRLAYHVSSWRHEPCINVSKDRAMQGARARVPVAHADARARGEIQDIRMELILNSTIL